MNTNDIREFDASCLNKRGTNVIIFGKPCSGKSTLIDWDLRHRMKNSFQDNLISISSMSSNDFDNFRFYDKGSYNHNVEFTSENLKQVFEAQRTLCGRYEEKYKAIYKGSKAGGLHTPGLLTVFDDCMFSNTIANDTNFTRIFMFNSFFNINTITSCQSIRDLTPPIRYQMDYIFISKTTNANEKRKLYQQYAGCFHTYQHFEEALDFLTSKPYTWMVIWNRPSSDSSSLFDQVFYYTTKRWSPYHLAATVIANKWRQIQAKRKLARLRVKQELEFIPMLGIKYEEAAEHFKSRTCYSFDKT